MASIIINDKQTIEDLYFEKFGIPMILCNSHQNSVYEFINLSSQNPNKLACAQCIIKYRINPDFLISVKDIFSKNPNIIIQNWPPMQDLNIYQHLMANELQEGKKIESIEQIDEYFDKLKVDILKIIDEHHKKILVHINRIEESRNRVIDLYNQISIKDEIKNEFLKNKDNLQQLEQYLKQIISKLQTSSQYNQSTIKSELYVFTKFEQQYQFDYIQQVFKKYLDDFKSIDILDPVLITEEQLQSQILKKKKDQDEGNKLSLKVDQIFEENEENEQKNDITEVDLLESLQIIKSNFGKPEYISLKKIEHNYFLIDQNGSQDWSQVIIDEELIGEKKYKIQIDIKYNKFNSIILGLMPISQKDKAGRQFKLSFCLSDSGDGIDKIERGKHISELKKDVQQINFQICLKEQILRCQSVVNNVKNINSLNDWNKINPNEKYYFYIALGGTYTIELNQFKIIKQFEQW